MNMRISAIVLTTLILAAPIVADIDSSYQSMAIFGINRHNGVLARHDFDDGQGQIIGTVADASGSVLFGIDAAAYVPGFQNIFAFWTDPSDGQSKMVYVNTETADASVVGQPIGPGDVTGAVATKVSVESGATTFDGVDDVIELPHADEHLLSDGTVIFSFRADEVSSQQGLFSKDSNGSGTGGHLSCFVGSSKITVSLGSASASYFVTSDQNVQADRWHHVVFTFGGQGMKLYLDGEQVASGSYVGGLDVRSGGSGNHEPIVIGAGRVAGNLQHFFEGKISGFKILNRVLSDEEIAVESATGSEWAVFALQTVEKHEDQAVGFSIDKDSIVPTESFAAKVTVLGSAISFDGQYDMLVTSLFEIAGQNYAPFGDFDSALAGNVNDDQNTRNYIWPGVFSAGTPINVIGRSWKKKDKQSNGTQDQHWKIHHTIDGSDTNSPYLIVLRDGDDVPDIAGFMDQGSVKEFVQNYIDPATNKIVLDDSQAIYLFELAMTDLNSEAADFQDLVVLVTLAKVPEDFGESVDDDDAGGPASRLLKVNHKTGEYQQLMSLDNLYDGLSSFDGRTFFATRGQELYKIEPTAQSEVLVGTMSAPEVLGLDFAGSTLMGFENVGDKLQPIDVMTGANLGTPGDVKMADLGTIVFMPLGQDPALRPKAYD